MVGGLSQNCSRSERNSFPQTKLCNLQSRKHLDFKACVHLDVSHCQEPGRFSGEGASPICHSMGAPRERVMLSKRLLLVVFCSLVFPICPQLFGQATGSFSGTVSDKTGSVVSGATVRATSQSTGLVRESKTDDTGHYLIPLLPVANFTIRVESQGFQAAETKDVRLQLDERRELNFTLAPAS